MTGEAPLGGGIIAAGEGRRLRRAGWTVPKPLVPVAGVPLIELVIRNFLAAHITSLTIIVNEQARDCVEWIRSRFPHLAPEFIVKSTGSSLESFMEVAARHPVGRMVISTVDAWCVEADFVRFVEAGRVTHLGERSGELVTAGMYLVPEHVRTMRAPSELGRLREFLTWLFRSGEPLYGEVIQTVVDVDRAEDRALAEALALAAMESSPRLGGVV